MEKLVLVNKKDGVVGYESKERVHKKGLLHRAFSVYIFNNKNQLLIQKRSKLKPLWPSYWANSCCSHPRKKEEYIKAAERRTEEELGFICPLIIKERFYYKAVYDKNIGSENELCTILTGKHNGRIKINSKEVEDFKWVDLEKLKKDIENKPDKYTPWFKIGLKKLLRVQKKEEKKYQELKLNFKKISKKINPVIYSLLDKYVDKKFHSLINYQATTGGKKIRSGLTVISSKLLNGKEKDVIFPAAGIEILHNYTLIVDDIIDNSRVRRGEPTTWRKFGKSIAECVGADYSATVFEAIGNSKKAPLISEIFAQTIKTIFDGEIYDILFEQKERKDEPYISKHQYSTVGEKNYYKMAIKKTAFLFQTCCEVGGISADASNKQLKALKNYGFNLGIAFQVIDDYLDIFGEEKEFGKEIGKDIKERKLGNIVINFALKELSNPDKNKVLKVLRKKEINNKDVDLVINLIKKTNSAQRAFHLAEDFSQKAKISLEFLPKNKWNNLLNNLADLVVYRQK